MYTELENKKIYNGYMYVYVSGLISCFCNGFVGSPFPQPASHVSISPPHILFPFFAPLNISSAACLFLFGMRVCSCIAPFIWSPMPRAGCIWNPSIPADPGSLCTFLATFPPIFAPQE